MGLVEVPPHAGLFGVQGGAVDTTVTPESLAQYVGAAPSDSEFVSECLGQAAVLVARFIRTAVIPADAVARAVLECGSELFHRRQAPNGIAQFAGLDGANAVRVARDPMVGAYPILAPFLGPAIA